ITMGREMGSVFFGLDRDGKKVYWINYRAAGIRKRERVGYRLSEAKTALESRMTDVRRGKLDGIFPEAHYTLNDIKTKYEKHSETVKSAETAVRDKGIIQLLVPTFGSKSLNQITAGDLEDWRSKRAADKVAPATINKEV